MRYLTIFKAVETGAPPDADEIAAMGKLIAEMASAGVLHSTEGCMPSAKGVRVRRADGNVTVTDGPFTETKEIVGGFAILHVASKEEAIAWTRRFLDVAGDGESEIRELYSEPAFEAESR